MYCKNLECHISTNACIKRQKIASKLEYIPKPLRASFKVCKYCEIGIRVAVNPKCFIDKNIKILKIKQQKCNKQRGWTFKSSCMMEDALKEIFTERMEKRRKENAKRKYKPKLKLKIRRDDSDVKRDFKRCVAAHRRTTRSEQNIFPPTKYALRIKQSEYA